MRTNAKTFAALVMAALSGGSLFAGIGDGWVADPYRAVGAKWNRYPVKGHDYWNLLHPRFSDLEGVKDLPMVKEGGVYDMEASLSPLIEKFTRRICIYGVKSKDEKGAAVKTTFRLESDEPNVVIDKGNGFTVLSAPWGDVKVRYLPASARLVISAERPFKTLDIAHGTVNGSRIAEIYRTSAPAKIALSERSCRLDLQKAVSELTLDIASLKPGHVMTGIKNEALYAERLKRVPFMVRAPGIIWRSIGAPKGFVRWEEFLDDLEERYPETFVGVEITEWDANFLQKITHGTNSRHLRDLMQVRDIPTDRNGMVYNMARHFDNYANLFGDKIVAMSGGLNFQLYSGDFGAKVICTELSGERCAKSQRLEMLYNQSAARQFDRPSNIYIAYYCGAQHPSSRYYYQARGEKMTGTDWGQAPSLSTRNFYPFYYMGGNYMTFESQPYGQVEPDGEKPGSWKLSGNGRAIADMHEWSRSEKGVRGDGYAPILLLEDRRSGNDQAHPLRTRPASFYGLFDSTDGDVMTEYIMCCISVANGHQSPVDPAGGSSRFNSSLGNVFNMALANPLRSSEVSARHLAKYAAVVIAGDLDWSKSLADRVKRYVAGGGTLLITAGQSYPFNEKFLGAKADPDDTVEADGLLVCKAKLQSGARVLKSTSNGLPLVTAFRYGAGQVNFVLSPFFKKAPSAIAKPRDRYIEPQQVKEVLEALQDAVLPVKVKGDCEFGLNRVDDGSWRVYLVNNLGSVKEPKSSIEKRLSEWAQDVTLTLPAGARAEEIRFGVKPVVKGNEWTFKVPPADVLVVKVDGIEARTPGEQADAIAKSYQPVVNFTRRFATTGRPNDGFRWDPATSPYRPTEKTPAVIGEWLAKNDFRDSLGSGRDMKIVGSFRKEGDAVYSDRNGKSFVSASFPAKFPLTQSTIETWVKPSLNPDDYVSDKRGNRGRIGGVLYLQNGQIYVYNANGRWCCATMGGVRRLDIVGPEIKDEWTHLAVTTDKELIRFYVNGREVVSPDGPLRMLSDNVLDGFTHRMWFLYGSSNPNWGFFFRGGMKGLKFHSRCFTPEELAKRAREMW